MNDEFAWRNGLGKLGGDVEPAHDLWPPIAARIAPRFARRWRAGLGLAAALAAAVAAGAFVWRAQPTPAPSAVVVAAAPTPLPAASAPLAWAMPADPALAAAAHDLDEATVKLQQAMESDPRAVFLVGLLNRTNDQRMRLLRQSAFAG
ncbi:MAG: hypothetical protein ACREPN_02430 [Rudaea sp.]